MCGRIRRPCIRIGDRGKPRSGVRRDVAAVNPADPPRPE
jgi:hypothetical protein